MKEFASPPRSRSRRFVLHLGGLIAIIGISLALCSCDKSGDDGDANSDEGAAGASGVAPALEPQIIKIERAATVGDRYHFDGEGHSRQVVEVSTGGKPMPERSQSEDFSVTMVADVEVLAINENGKASKVTVLVKTLTRADDDAAAETLLENTVVDAANEAGGVVYSIGGVAVEKEIQQAIKLFTLLNSNAAKADEDAIFGTNESHAPGDEWPVDEAVIANFFSEDTGMELVPDSIEGAMKFVKVDRVAGIVCQLLSGQVSMEMASFPGVPDVAELSDSTVEVSLSGAFPIDPLLPVAEKSMTMKMAPSLEYTKNGITIGMKMTIERAVTSRKTVRK